MFYAGSQQQPASVRDKVRDAVKRVRACLKTAANGAREPLMTAAGGAKEFVAGPVPEVMYINARDNPNGASPTTVKQLMMVMRP